MENLYLMPLFYGWVVSLGAWIICILAIVISGDRAARRRWFFAAITSGALMLVFSSAGLFLSYGD